MTMTERCNHRIFDTKRFTSRECGGKAIAHEALGPRCRRHTRQAIEDKRRAMDARVQAKVAGVISRTKHLTDEL